MANTESRTATASHTPGPWIIFAAEQFIEICPAMRPGDICKVERAPFEGSAAANALLITAAPDLLMALSWLLGLLETPSADEHYDQILLARGAARAAISKATGAVGDREGDATGQRQPEPNVASKGA